MTEKTEKPRERRGMSLADRLSVSRFAKTTVDCGVLSDALRTRFGDGIVSLEVREHKGGRADEVQSRDLWVEVTPETFRPFVEELFAYDFVNFHVISGNDGGDDVALNYHFSLFQRERGGRIGVVCTVRVPKSDLSLPSIFDLLPGSEYSERETREMFGVDFAGLPNKALVFLPEDWNEEIKPWRRDAAGPAPELVRELS
ncbi:MAG: NADH-quinone oxidoreductase subunit C [Synergistaceae bacterium]|jgi:membrane-bound hydrogenase subunit beta|nr:NADH-quinone oxidoreductase subunit C [Synergistaceae bacterium]